MTMTYTERLAAMEARLLDIRNPELDEMLTAADLIEVGNLAKNEGWYVIANLMMAAVLAAATHNNEIEIAVETRGLSGDPNSQWFDPIEAYYDLVVVEAGGRSLNIPTPLLDSESVAAAYLKAAVTDNLRDRGEHGGRCLPDDAPADHVERMHAIVAAALATRRLAAWQQMAQRYLADPAEVLDWLDRALVSA